MLHLGYVQLADTFSSGRAGGPHAESPPDHVRNLCPLRRMGRVVVTDISCWRHGQDEVP
jgi:hypothetical protein